VRHAALILLAVAAAFWGVEGLIFHTSFYPNLIAPDSSAGFLEARLDNEIRRPPDGHPQVLGIGDSRMGALHPKAANQFTGQTGLTFASISVPGSTPRCWYYMLRDTDPGAKRYAAIVMGVEDYDDGELWEPRADRESDLHYLIARLRWSDLLEFSSSYHNPKLQREAFRAILFKGLIFKRDFEDFLRHPKARLDYVELSRRDSHTWFYDYVDTSKTLEGVRVDFAARTVTVPPGLRPDIEDGLRGRLLNPRPPEKGQDGAYMRYWLGRIYDLYRGSKTKLVFLRLPRGGFVRPDQAPVNPYSSVRELAARPEVRLIPEDFYNGLERPELFYDEAHMNQLGGDEFSRMLAFEVRDLLGS
jgi:hypothetical protein